MRKILLLAALSLIFVGAISPAYAYLDPGTGSILIQALIGLIAAAAVSFRLYFGRIKNIFLRLMRKGEGQEKEKAE